MTTTRGLQKLTLATVMMMVAAGCAPLPAGDDQSDPTGTPTGTTPEDFAQVQVALTNVPPLTTCVRFTITAGTTSSTQLFTVVPGMPAMLLVKGLPPAQALTLRAEAFTAACTAVTAATLPTWVSDPVAANLGPGQIAMLTFVLRPAASVSGTVDFLSLTIAPTSFAFGSGVVGVPSASTATLTVRNVGTAATGVLAASLAGAAAADFTITSNTCTVALAGNPTTPPSCTVQIKFLPVTVGNKTASLQVTGTPGGTITAALTGTGLAPAQLVLTPNAVNFGNQVINTAPGQTNGFTVANIGGVTSGPLAFAVSDPSFLLSPGCPTPLGPGQSCGLVVTFLPTTPGLKTATVTVSTTAPGIPGVATLTGTAVTPAALAVMPPMIDFGVVSVLTGSDPRGPIIVRNLGGGPSTPLTVNFTNSSTFAPVNDGCSGVALAPGAICSFFVRATPLPFSGPFFSGSVIINAAVGGTVSVQLTGQTGS